MKVSASRQYEQAFENLLIDSNIPYILVDQQKRAAFSRCSIKSFDFLIYNRIGQAILVELKGRKFRGNTLAGMSSLECWVTTDDIDGLLNWRDVFGKDSKTVFIFAYLIEAVDVDFDGREVFEFDSNRYVFLCVKLEDYMRFMKSRSPKWHTVSLPADKFRQCAVELAELLA